MQRERRRDPYPWTWEIPAGIALVVLISLVLGAQVGRFLANLLAGAGWTWPASDTGSPSPIGSAFWSSLPAVLTGHAGAGLPHPTPAALAGPQLVWTGIALTECAILAAMVWASVHLYQRWGPGRLRGMATRAEAEKLLGVTRLKKVSALVRPDLYGKHAHPLPLSRPALRPFHRDADQPEPGTVELGSGLSPWLLPGRFGKETPR